MIEEKEQQDKPVEDKEKVQGKSATASGKKMKSNKTSLLKRMPRMPFKN